MSIEPNEFQDPYGRISDLQYWLAQCTTQTEPMSDEERAAETLMAAGRCIVDGLPIQAHFSKDSLSRLLESGGRGLAILSDENCRNVETLVEDWTAMDDVWEADDLCNSILSRRTDFWSVEELLNQFGMEIPPVLQSSLDRQDTALRANLNVLASVTTSTEFQNICGQIAEPFSKQLPWWLGEELHRTVALQRSMFETTTDTAVVRLAQQKWWQEIIPADESGLISLAADDSSPEQMPVLFVVLKWRSPNDASIYATIDLPRHSDSKIEEEKLVLSVWVNNSDQSKIRMNDLSGNAARIGSSIVAFNQSSVAIFYLRDLRTSLDGLLWIGSDSRPWELVIE